MTFIVSHVSVAEAATIINALITFIQCTISASFIILLIFFMPKTNSALSWSSVTRTLHSSIWPTLLRSDSSSSRSAGTTVSIISSLTMITTALITIAGVTLPLGLHEGPLLQGNSQVFSARYVPDTSPLALATTPNREDFHHGRMCGGLFGSVACPGNNGNPNITTYAPSIVDIFNSTPNGPFATQYRRFFTSSINGNLSSGALGTAQSLVLRDGIFAVEGLVVDMSASQPGLGFLNQTMPDIPQGGMWSQDVLWLEPVTACVDTNLTADYILSDEPGMTIEAFNITDHGGFSRLTHDYPPLNRDGQNIDLVQHAYKGAVLSNFYAMLYLNATRESSFDGKNYTLKNVLGIGLDGVTLGKTTYLPLSYLNSSVNSDLAVSCEGFGGQDTANVTNVHVSCGAFLGPPLRMDGGDRRIFDQGSQWSQHIHACASTTRASIQKITFWTNDTSDLQNLRITRQRSEQPVLWAIEKTDIKISEIDLLWGRVDDRYENDPSLWTIRNYTLYLPAGGSGLLGWSLPAGQPIAAYGGSWGAVYFGGSDGLADYTGSSDYAMKAKFQSFVEQDPVLGYARIQNAIWTDVMANNVAGTPRPSTLLVAPNQPSIEYDFRFAIPALILVAIWAPAFLVSVILLITRMLEFEYIRQVLNHTSVGRVVVGTSVLRAHSYEPGGLYSMPESSFNGSTNHSGASFVDLSKSGGSPGHRREKCNWAGTTGTTHVTLDLDRKASHGSTAHLIP